MERLKIALLAGGDSSEREIALRSAAQVAAAIDTSKYDVYVIDLHHRDWHYTASDGREIQVDKNDFSLRLDDSRRIVFDYALIIIHGTPGENGRLQGYLEMMQVPFSSCSMTSSVVTFDKITTKRAVAGRGINLARDILLSRGEHVDAEAIATQLGLPLFVKPNASGSSCGVTKVERSEDIAQAVEDAFAESDEVLIEEFIAGREFGCGIFLSDKEELILPLTEIISRKDFFDYEAKYTAGMSSEITPAEVDEATAERIRSMARTAYRACRCRGLVRVDFIVTPAGEPYMIEINTIPGMSSGSIVPKQIAAAGMTLGEVLDRIIETTMRR